MPMSREDLRIKGNCVRRTENSSAKKAPTCLPSSAGKPAGRISQIKLQTQKRLFRIRNKRFQFYVNQFYAS